MKKALEWIWSLKILKGHRSKVAKFGLMLTSAALAYQGIATSDQLIASGIDLPDLTSGLLGVLGVVSVFFAGKMKQFVREHKE